MDITKIQSLLETKFQGVRKDGLAVLAQSISLTYENDEDIENLINKMDEAKANAFVNNLRKDIDRETQNAIKTAETNLRKKFDFVEKGNPAPAPQPTPPETPNGGSHKDSKILETLQMLQNQILGLQQKEAFNSRKADFLSIFENEKLPKTFTKGLESNFALQQFKDDEEYNAYKEQIKQSISNFKQELADNGLGNQATPQFGNNKPAETVSPYVQAFLAEKEKGSAEEGKPLFD